MLSQEQLLRDCKDTECRKSKVIYEYQKKGLIEKVKRDFYVVISLETKHLFFTYQIGSIFFSVPAPPHSAFGGNVGYGSQVFYRCLFNR